MSATLVISDLFAAAPEVRSVAPAEAISATALAAVLAQLRLERLRLGMTQCDVADRMGVSQSAVARIEAALSGGPMPKFQTLEAYARALGKTLSLRLV